MFFPFSAWLMFSRSVVSLLKSGGCLGIHKDVRRMEDGMSATRHGGMPEAQGLYDPAHEHDACGVGFVVDIKGRKSHAIVSQALQVLKNLLHRGACGCEVNTGDGAGIRIQMPHAFLSRECAALGISLPSPRHYGAGSRPTTLRWGRARARPSPPSNRCSSAGAPVSPTRRPSSASSTSSVSGSST